MVITNNALLNNVTQNSAWYFSQWKVVSQNKQTWKRKKLNLAFTFFVDGRDREREIEEWKMTSSPAPEAGGLQVSLCETKEIKGMVFLMRSVHAEDACAVSLDAGGTSLTCFFDSLSWRNQICWWVKCRVNLIWLIKNEKEGRTGHRKKKKRCEPVPGSLKLESWKNTMLLFVHVVQPQHMSGQVTVSSCWAASCGSMHSLAMCYLTCGSFDIQS